MNETDLGVFGVTLRHYRKRAELTQAELAERMAAAGHPWHTSTVSKTESGQRDPTMSEIIHLARILGDVPAHKLVPDAIILGQAEQVEQDAQAGVEAAEAESEADEVAFRAQQVRSQIADLHKFEDALLAHEKALRNYASGLLARANLTVEAEVTREEDT